MNKVIAHVKKAFLRILPALFYFLIMFYILMISRAVTLKQYGITVPMSTAALIGALIFAKVVLVTDRIPFLNLYPKKPLIYNVTLKTTVFGSATLVFLLAEELVRFARKNGGFENAWHHMSVNFVWPAFLVRAMWVFVLVLFYCAWSELTNVLGAHKVKEIFFGSQGKTEKRQG